MTTWNIESQDGNRTYAIEAEYIEHAADGALRLWSNEDNLLAVFAIGTWKAIYKYAPQEMLTR